MKKQFLILILILINIPMFAQRQRGERGGKEQLQAQKVAYITNKLQLTPDESAKFWPIYNEWEAKRNDIRESEELPEDISSLSDKEAETLLNDIMTQKDKELALLKTYVGRLKTAVPTKKVAQLLLVERDFRKEMMENIKSRMENRQQRPGSRRN